MVIIVKTNLEILSIYSKRVQTGKAQNDYELSLFRLHQCLFAEFVSWAILVPTGALQDHIDSYMGEKPRGIVTLVLFMPVGIMES